MPSRSENPADTAALAAREDLVTLADKVRFLSACQAYASRPRGVTVIETHMSWVFLAGERAYKLKKPVRYPFLDFSTLAAREADARKEIRLNRRLAPDLYLGVQPLTVDASGQLALDGQGRIVDWLVAMGRLPAARMLDQAIANGTVTRDRILAVAARLAEFYRSAAPAELEPSAYVEGFAREHDLNKEILTDPAFGLGDDRWAPVFKRMEHMLRAEAALLEARVERGHVVDGHGDLRPEHICLTDPPVVIDCLEFNRTLRLVDPFDELTFLALECGRLGADWVGQLIIDRCAESLQDRPCDRLFAFYRTYRACLRARLALSHLREPDPREPARWVPLARTYLDLAEKASLRIDLPAAR
ncbi:MAG: hypothetical protein QNJ94_20475 [Alphaproteobacteria bacterium]|nr:hypothetical protein [Alphaproteobacteria bacterium]